MSDKAKSIYFAGFAIVYLGYTVFIAGHGIHFTNSAITIGSVVVAIYYYAKTRASK